MSQLLMPGSVVAISAQAVDQLLQLDQGDAALLYLHLLRHSTLEGLRWTSHRQREAQRVLESCGLVESPQKPQPEPSVEPPPSNYTQDDVIQELQQPMSHFPLICQEVERRLGKKLSPIDLNMLYELYTYAALPTEVIFLLLNWCIEDCERRQGQGRRPFLAKIRQEGFYWSKLGIDTVDLAEAHIQRLTRLSSREGEICSLLNMANRPLVKAEKMFIEAWDQWGFSNDVLRQAYERTVLKKQQMDWNYMNGILNNWHQRGLHTLADIQAQEGKASRGRRPQPSKPDVQTREDAQEMEQMRRFADQLDIREDLGHDL